MRRLYVGGEIGQGYPGDEDNGEMSAWYIFSSLGFYPLQWAAQLGHRLAAVQEDDGPPQHGRDIVVNAPDNSPERLRAGRKVNGRR